jgi:hypothetical protein
VQGLINKLSHNILNIKKKADKNKVKSIVISVPSPVYVSSAYFKQAEKLGLRLDNKMLSGDSMDQAIMLACQRANVKFFEVTQNFREESKNHLLYFAMDGHFNPDGNKHFAKIITPIIENELKSIDTSAR